MTIDLSERQLRLALQNVPVPMFVHDETGRVRYLNEAFLRLSGYRPEQVPTLRAWLDLAHPDRERARLVIDAHRAGYGDKPSALAQGGDYQIRVADGSIRIWQFQAYAIGRDENGLAVNVSMAIDVTGERRSREDLARSEGKLRQALRIGRSGDFERDFSRRLAHYSDELLDIHGLPAEQRSETLERWFARVHPADRGHVVAYAEALTDPDPPLAIQYRIIRRNDGEVRYIAERRAVTRDAKGRAIGCVGLQRDVTEARAAEQALRESEARLRLSLEAGQVGAFDWNLRSGELIWDDRVREIFGVEPGAPVSIETFYRGVHPDDVERIGAIIAASHDQSGDGAYVAEYRVVNARDRSLRHVSARGRTWFEDGRPASMLGVVVEVTAMREAQAVLERDRAELERLVEARTAELAETQARLAQAERMAALAQLAGGIAHDFNNVLQAVEAACDLIERKPGQGDVPRYLRLAREATERGAAISRRLVSFAPGAQLDPQRVEVARLIAEAAQVLRQRFGAGLAVEVDCEASLPAVMADRRQLEMALFNLAANACEAMQGAGRIVLRARAETGREAGDTLYRARLKNGAYVRLEIVDTGRGMDPALSARAMEPFFSTKPRGQGAGLGLSIARSFAEQSDGALALLTEPGQGASVALWLPVAPETAAKSQARAETGRGRLLLVDDDPLVRELVAEQLRAAGFSVTACEAGKTALERLDSGLAVDLLVTDFAMPLMNGIALAREARKRRPRLPIVMLTGFANEAAKEAAESEISLLYKPIDRQALIGRVSELVGAR